MQSCKHTYLSIFVNIDRLFLPIAIAYCFSSLASCSATLYLDPRFHVLLAGQLLKPADMAAFGAVASLLKTLDSADSVLHHLGPQIKSLRDKVSFLQDSLEKCFGKITNQEIYEESLEAKIRDTVVKAEDLIASKMVKAPDLDQASMDGSMFFAAISVVLLAKSQNISRSFNLQVFVAIFSVIYFSDKNRVTRIWRKIKLGLVKIMKLVKVLDEDLGEIIQEIECIADEVKKILDDHGVEGQLKLARNDPSVALPSSGIKNSIASGKRVVSRFKNDVEGTRSRLYDGLSNLEIVPIVGMGGIGKTTLARFIYDDTCFPHHFDIRAWTTVSQEYTLHKVLVNLLESGKMLTTTREEMNRKSEEDLTLNLYRHLMGRRYLIVMDDVWDTYIWDVLQKYFPSHNDNNGSRVLLTTRLSEVALYVNPCSPVHQMSLLNKDDSWNLLCNVVFGENTCPMELELIGKEIARNCKGLPLVLGVIGGVLHKVTRTNEAWKFVADNLNSIVTKDDEQCMEILSLSYKRLPHHLRPCFLYMAMFPQDHVIRMDELSFLLAAEGFLQPHKNESIQVLGEKCLKDLAERNLILLHRWSADNVIKTCSIHDMLWNFCMQRAQKESFFHVAKCTVNAVLQNGFGAHRRFSVHHSLDNITPEILFDNMKPDSSAHSLICNGPQNIEFPKMYLGHHMLLKVLDLFIITFMVFPDIITRFLNLRYLAITCNGALPPSISRLQNLETLIQGYSNYYHQCHFLPAEISLMLNLSNIWIIGSRENDRLGAQIQIREGFLLPENLQTLRTVKNLHCGFILGRMPNLRELWISYDDWPSTVSSNYQLEVLANLHQLKVLYLEMSYGFRYRTRLPDGFAFPQTLNRLTLIGCEFPWESMKLVGSLPCLEVLRLEMNACQGKEWVPNVNEFLQLKYLLLREIDDLVHWNADETHFPRLQHLIIISCHSLEEIPSSIGDIPTLERIELMDCPLAMTSASQILKEQKEVGNEDLKVVVVKEFEEWKRAGKYVIEAQSKRI